MESSVPSPLILTEDALRESLETIAQVVGTKWFDRKVRQATKQATPKSLRTYSYLRQPQHHPLVELFLEFERWRESGARAEPAPAIANIGLLGDALKLVRAQPGFNRVVQRLRKAREFESAAFEAEVAASYVRRGWKIEFVEEGDDRAPDLYVTRSDGTDFWAECKRRDKLTERDKLVESIWDDLALSLMRAMGPQRLNYFVAVASKHDPERQDVAYLREIILNTIQSGGIGSFEPSSQSVRMVGDESGKFELVVQKLAEPNELCAGYPVSLDTVRSFDVSKCGWESPDQSLKASVVRNPIFIGLKSYSLPDRVSGVVTALKAAVGQIPEQGPGVVWICIPDNQWAYTLDNSLARTKELLQGELSGDQNRRVNAAIVITGAFRKVQKNGFEGLIYERLQVLIEHNNPRKPYAP